MVSVLENDMLDLKNSDLEFSKFKEKVFFITGATGLIGSLLTKSLLYLNQTMNLNLRVVAVIRNQAKADNIYRNFLSNDALSFYKNNLGVDRIDYSGSIDFIIHAASVTASKLMVTDPVGTIRTAVGGTQEVLKLAKHCNVSSMVYISSMEVYGQVEQSDKISEKSLGYIDLSNPRSCYPESKRMCEMLCTAYCTQYGLKVTSARLAQTFGAGILKGENRVFAQFSRSALRGEDIVLRTLGLSEGNYVYTMDAIRAILILLTKGRAGEAYNISNEKSHITIKEMAKLVAANFSNGKSQVVVDIPKGENLGYAPDTKMWLDSAKIKSLGWSPKVDLLESYSRMIKWMKENGF